MPAVVRVKRRIDEEPLSAFVLNGKKRRLDNAYENDAVDIAVKNSIGSGGDVSTVLKFAGTIDQQDNNATKRFARLTKKDAKETVLMKQSRSINTTEQVRQQVREAANENRFKIVNCMRTTMNFDDEADEADENASSTNDIDRGPSTSQSKKATAEEITIVDIEKQQIDNPPSNGDSILTQNIDDTGVIAGTENMSLNTCDSDINYVYDLYVPENEQQAENVDLMDNNNLSVRPFDDLFYEDCYINEHDDADSEDSNHENYYTNDYPDEDDDYENSDGSIYDEFDAPQDLLSGIHNLRLDSEDVNSLKNSSDDDDDIDPYHDNMHSHLSRQYFNNYNLYGSSDQYDEDANVYENVSNNESDDSD